MTNKTGLQKVTVHAIGSYLVECIISKTDKRGESAYWRIRSFENGKILLRSEKYKNIQACKKVAKKLAVNLKGSIYRELDKR